MGSFSVSSSSGWDKTETFLRRLTDRNIFRELDKYGAQGVAALSRATPVDSDITANSWTYDIVARSGYYSIRWRNTHMAGGIPVVILLQYGHGTRNGGYVQGRDFIMPAITPIFDQIEADVRKVVSA